MVEPIMYFGIGFLVAALLALLFFPLVHNRAVRLTMRRLEAATPLTIAEIRADKDQLRAEFAMSTRRLELSVEQMKAKTTSQLAELGKKTDAINQLKKELGEKTAAIFALEARDKTLLEQMRASEEEYELKSSSLREAERTLSDKEAELSKLVAELGDQSINADSQRVELAALRAQVEALKAGVADYELTIKETEERLTRERSESAAVTTDLTDARGKLEGLNGRTAELERHLQGQTAEAELLNRRVQELESRLGDQGKLLAERDYEIERLRAEAQAARKMEGDLRGELANAGSRDSGATEKLKADIAQRDAQLAAAIEERTKLQAEIASMKQEAETAWASERVENALLRERINDVAAEVARLTAALEGPGSPIETMLAAAHGSQHASGPANGKGAANGNRGNGEAGPAKIDPAAAAAQKGTLADRIRALQASASRVAQSN
jgi:predicted  nucleic acid-binding Zn-ribbon protein